MKRDMDLVRKILLLVAESKNGWDMQAISEYPEDVVSYHIKIMLEADLLAAINASTTQGDVYLDCRLTWWGNDFLDAALEDTRWNEAKKVIQKVGGASIQVWTSVLTKITLDSLGL